MIIWTVMIMIACAAIWWHEKVLCWLILCAFAGYGASKAGEAIEDWYRKIRED